MSTVSQEDRLLGATILNDPVLNKDTGFTIEDRRRLKLEGLLPEEVESLERQMKRVLEHLASKTDDIERYIYLLGLCDRNETLFYATVMSDPARFVPLIYNPTIAAACLRYGHIYRRPRGMYLSRSMKGRFVEVLRNWPQKNVRFVCVSSGGRILGLGDIGVNGAPIPVGKLQLYTACAGVPPDALLPILLDIGTTNVALRSDPFYLGLREEPPSEDDVDEIVDEFVAAVEEVYPGCCIHFEDWKGTDAMRLLTRLRDKTLCFNDDIQGTAGVCLSGLINALRIVGSTLRDQRIFLVGSGSAGIGIADMVVEAMVDEGVSRQDARARIAMFNSKGLIEASRADLSPSQRIYAQPAPPTKDLRAAIERFQPTALIGVSARGGVFTRDVIELMGELNARPIIFPLSNPTDKAECTAEQAYTWTEGRALVACGVQFPDVTLGTRTYHPGQANNFYVFPAIGMAVYATRPQRISDRMFIEAARAIADQVRPAALAAGMLFPLQEDILGTEITAATRVAEFIFDQGMATVDRPRDVGAWVRDMSYKPRY